MTCSNCINGECIGRCEAEKRHPPLVESMRESAKQLRRDAARLADIRKHLAPKSRGDESVYEKYEKHYSDVAAYLEKEIERAEKLHAKLEVNR